jgi:uncharacterized damage-inducible protein DinB
MKELLMQYAAYNVWANHKIIFAIEQLPEELWYKQTPSSFDTLFKTVLHMWDAESIWWQRIRLHEHIVIPSQQFDSSLKDACNGLLHQSMQWEDYVRQLDAPALNSDLIYKNSQGEQFFQPLPEVLHHVFNHGTYHRGQLVTMMRCLGAANVPATDFIQYARRKEG